MKSKKKNALLDADWLDLDVISSTGLGSMNPNYFKRLGKQKGRVVIHNQVNISSRKGTQAFLNLAQWFVQPFWIFLEEWNRMESIPVRCTSCWVIHFPPNFRPPATCRWLQRSGVAWCFLHRCRHGVSGQGTL